MPKVGVYVRQLVPIAVLSWLAGCLSLDGLQLDGGSARGVDEGEGDSTPAGDAGSKGPGEGPPVPHLDPITSCFAAGTPIDTPDGERAIEELAVGDAVWAFDTQRSVRVHSTVTALHRHPAVALGRLIAPDGRALLVTDNHPIYLPALDRFVPAGELTGEEPLMQIGDDGEPLLAEVTGFEPQVAHAPVFNITVADQHNYFAAGLLVHNKQRPPCDNYDWTTGTGCNTPPPSCVDTNGQPSSNCTRPPPPVVPPEIESCFAAGTGIATPSGERAIETLAVGDEVFAFDTGSSTRIVSRVTAVHRHPAHRLGSLPLPDGRTLRVTENHPIYLPERGMFVPAGELTSGHALLSLDENGGTRALAASAFTADTGYVPVFDITVAGVHNYFANGVLVHNKEAPPCPTYDWSTGLGCEHPVVAEGITCEPYPSAALDAEAYVVRLNEYVLDAAPLDAAAIPDPADFVQRNEVLVRRLGESSRLELGRALARWLRVPVNRVENGGGSLDQQLAWQLAYDLGSVAIRPEGSPLMELFAYREGMFTAQLAAFHGLTDFDASLGATQLLELPEERRGVLTEVAFLRAHPTPSDRGRVIDELLLCGSWQAHAPPALPPLPITTRYAAYTALASNAACAQCHAVIDPIGLTLEQFDATGIYRTTEAGQPVPSAGHVHGTAADGPIALADSLLADVTLATCAAESLLSSALRRPLTAADACSVQWVVLGMQNRVDLRGALLSVITSPAFLHEPP